MTETSLHLPTPAAAEALGAAAGRGLKVGEAICLWGPLGAGKTTLARGLIRSLTRPEEEVPSPTFTLVQTYDGPRFPLAHFDLYRIARPEAHGQLIAQARDEALRTMKENPKLTGSRGEALRCLLYLYERGEAVPLMGAG